MVLQPSAIAGGPWSLLLRAHGGRFDQHPVRLNKQPLNRTVHQRRRKKAKTAIKKLKEKSQDSHNTEKSKKKKLSQFPTFQSSVPDVLH